MSVKIATIKAFKVSLPTFNSWLKLIPDLNLVKNKRILTPKQVEMVFSHLDEPHQINASLLELTCINLG
jgi:hypothetical protein